MGNVFNSGKNDDHKRNKIINPEMIFDTDFDDEDDDSMCIYLFFYLKKVF